MRERLQRGLNSLHRIRTNLCAFGQGSPCLFKNGRQLFQPHRGGARTAMVEGPPQQRQNRESGENQENGDEWCVSHTGM